MSGLSARFAQRLMLPVSNDTLLRVIRRQGSPPSIPPSVIGITSAFPVRSGYLSSI